MIISAVTAASSVEAARSVEPHLTGAPYYLDINSVSPGRKQETAKLLGDKARYVDVAVIAPIHPLRHKTPMLIAGPHAEAISPLLSELEMKLRVVGADTGARRRDQDDPQRDDQGHRGADARMFPRRQPRRRARRGHGLAEEQLSRPRLAENVGIQSRAHGEPRRAPRRRDGRIGRDVARTRARSADGRTPPSSVSAKWARSARTTRPC